MSDIDPVQLAQTLIRCPSVTPKDEGALDLLEKALKPLGFVCHRLRFEGSGGTYPVDNLYARFGTSSPNFCFAGHTDVVPPGERGQWQRDPFSGEIHDGMLFGRGAADMKSAIACFVAAAARFIGENPKPGFSISLLVTGDEEDESLNGTVKVLEWMKAQGETIDHCVVGEPSSAVHAGDTIKIGRRGSMNVSATVKGIQGHAAYPHLALNPVPILADLVRRLASLMLDHGTPHFEPSTLAFTTLETGNRATNVIPAEARAGFNIRFNDLHTPDSLMEQIRAIGAQLAKEKGGEIAFSNVVSGVAFVTKPGPFVNLLSSAAKSVTGKEPQLSTGGGTSDARFIQYYCPVAELGLSGASMHKANECASIADIEALTRIYGAVLAAYGQSKPA